MKDLVELLEAVYRNVFNSDSPKPFKILLLLTSAAIVLWVLTRIYPAPDPLTACNPENLGPRERCVLLPEENFFCSGPVNGSKCTSGVEVKDAKLEVKADSTGNLSSVLTGSASSVVNNRCFVGKGGAPWIKLVLLDRKGNPIGGDAKIQALGEVDVNGKKRPFSSTDGSVQEGPEKHFTHQDLLYAKSFRLILSQITGWTSCN